MAVAPPIETPSAPQLVVAPPLVEMAVVPVPVPPVVEAPPVAASAIAAEATAAAEVAVAAEAAPLPIAAVAADPSPSVAGSANQRGSYGRPPAPALSGRGIYNRRLI